YNFNQSASSGSFSTGTGNVSLNGNTTLAVGKTLTLTGFAQGSVLYTNGSAVVTAATGTSSQLLHGGTTPFFGAVNLESEVSCILPVANGGSPFDAANGTIFARNITEDLLLGSQATDSARFAFINVNSGTPTASLSGTLGSSILTAEGSLSTTNAQTLSLGGIATGNIILDSGSGLITLNDNTNLNGSLTVADDNTVNLWGITYSGGAGNANEGIRLPQLTNTTNTPAAAGYIGYDTATNKLAFFNGTLWSDVTDSAGSSKFTLVGNILYPNLIANQIGIGTQTPSDIISSLYITRNLASGALGKSLVVFNQAEDQDIFTASASGATRFTIANNGDLRATGAISGLTGITSAGNITFTGLNSAGVVHTNGAGLLSTSAVNLNGGPSEITGILPITNGGSPFDTANGAIFERNTSQDFLIGGQSTASAKFAFINVDSGTPVASLSAGSDNNTFLSADGNLGTTNAQTLTLGGASTGNVVIDAGSDLITLSDNTAILGNITASGTTGITLSGADADLTFTGGGNNDITASGGTLRFGAATLTGTITGANQAISGIGNISAASSANTITGFGTIGTTGTTNFNGVSLTLTGGASPDITTTVNNNLTINPSGSGKIVLISDADTGVYVGSSANTPAPLSVSGGIGSNASLIVNNRNSGDLIAASASGTTKFAISNNGDIRFAGSTSNLSTLTKVSGTSQIYTFPDATGTVCISGQTCATSGIVGYFQRNAGALAPANITDDLLLGAIATDSAKFAFLNVAGGTPTASISAGTPDNALFLTGDGSIQTTNMQSLTLGGPATGNIVINNPTNLNANLTVSDGNRIDLWGITYSGGAGAANEGFRLPQVTSVLDTPPAAGFIGYNTNSNKLTFFNGTSWSDVTDSAGSSKFTAVGDILYPNSIANQIGIGTQTVGDITSSFYVTRNLSSGALGKALVVFNQTENQDIFTASASGQTKFTIGNTGNISASGTLTGLTGLASSGTVTFSGLNTAGVVHTDGAGILSTSAVNLNGGPSEITGILPIANGGSPFDANNGAIFERNLTQDFLLGSQATSS